MDHERAADPENAAAPPDPVDGETEENISLKPGPGLTPVCVQYAKPDAWVQRVVYVSDRCNSDRLKWALVNHTRKSPSAVRVIDGFRGKPYDRFRPIVQGPNFCQAGEELRGPLIIAPAYGPE